MSNLIFPQLSSGALAQYPISKMRTLRTVKNTLANGTVVAFPDPKGGRMLWQLNYVDLSTEDVQKLQAHAGACRGPFHSFVFLDPTENLLNGSANPGGSAWQRPTSLLVSGGVADPREGRNAYVATNQGAAAQEILQTLAIPANYLYCFSIYARCIENSTLTLVRRGAQTEQASAVPIGPNWMRVSTSGSLTDSGQAFTVAIRLKAGQSVELYGPQLEAQAQPSAYRATAQMGGVYPNAHLVGEDFAIEATGPDQFSVSVIVEAPTQD